LPDGFGDEPGFTAGFARRIIVPFLGEGLEETDFFGAVLFEDVFLAAAFLGAAFLGAAFLAAAFLGAALLVEDRVADPDFPEVALSPDFWDPPLRAPPLADDFFGAAFLEAERWGPDFLAVDFVGADDLLEAPFLAGTFAPFLRASDRPIAIACFRSVTFCPDPLFSFPFFISFITVSTFLPADFEYFAIKWNLLS
jgi:hypothetical protein